MPNKWLHARRTFRGDLDVHQLEMRSRETPRVALVDPYYGATAQLPSIEKITGLFPAEMADIDAVVFRDVTSLRTDEVLAIEVADSLRAKYGREIEICTLSLERVDNNYRVACTHRAGPRLGTDTFLSELRQLEFHAQMCRSGAIYQPSKAHVRLPSGAHSDVYLRIADLFDDPVFVRRAADWLDHRIDSSTIILADTWTILPLLQELSRRHGETGEPRFSNAPPIHTFASYPDPDEVRRTFEQISAQLVSRGRVLLLMSVVSSGGLLRNVRALCERYLPGVDLDVVALANTDSSVAVDSLFVVDGIRRFSAEGCELCARPETQALVSIDTKRYFPSFKGKRRTEMITPPLAGEHKAFWEAADKCDAILVHAWVSPTLVGDVSLSSDAPQDLRHRPIAIDVAALLEKSTSFHEDVLDSLAAFMPRCDVLVVPSHHATDALLKLGRQLYPDVKLINLQAPWPTTGREALRTKLAGARRILILDDTVVSGKTFRIIHRLIQDLIHDLPKNEQPHKDYSISAYSVIGRPQSESQWRRLSDSLRQGSSPSLKCYKQILMPDHCPWCEEKNRIGEVSRRLRSGPLFGDPSQGDLATRLEVLDGRMNLLDTPQTSGLSGMKHSLFVCGANGELGARESDRLTWHSLFGEKLSEATTYAAVATAMHAVRLAALDHQHERQATAWAWDWAAQRILTAYHDPLIQASFLRAALTEELRMELTPELAASVEEAFYAIRAPARHVSPMLAGEHKLAAVLQKYGPAMRTLILEHADEALALQAKEGAEVRPVMTYLATLEQDLLLPTQLAHRTTP